MDIRPFNVLSLCSGAGGLDHGLRLAVPSARAVCYVEIEAYACEVLATRMEEKLLHPAPIWSNIKTFDGKRWRGLVDCVIGGYPCQPFSAAGRRLGEHDPRHLWPYVARIVEDIDPDYCFFENVEGHVNIGFEQVKSELERLCYRVEAGLFSAAEVGASHLRKRLFILGTHERTLADTTSARLDRGERTEQYLFRQALQASRSCHSQPPLANAEGNVGRAESESQGTGPSTCGGNVADSGNGLVQESGRGPEGRDGVGSDGEILADTNGEHGNAGGYAAGDVRRDRPPQAEVSGCGEHVADPKGVRGIEVQRVKSHGVLPSVGQNSDGLVFPGGVVPLFPPKPGEFGAWEEVLEIEPTLEPAICNVVDELADGMGECESAGRIDQLRLLGNGVVPSTAAFAFNVLLSRAAVNAAKANEEK